jgi:hypothetical protein
MHGAPIQCTRGKCPKAFHISCALEGAENGIVYEELGEVDKDVVLVDVTPVPSFCAPTPMDIDGNVPPPQDAPSDSVDSNKEAIKVVKKIEFQLLCPQHNPVGVRPDLISGSFRLSHSYVAPVRSKES